MIPAIFGMVTLVLHILGLAYGATVFWSLFPQWWPTAPKWLKSPPWAVLAVYIVYRLFHFPQPLRILTHQQAPSPYVLTDAMAYFLLVFATDALIWAFCLAAFNFTPWRRR